MDYFPLTAIVMIPAFIFLVWKVFCKKKNVEASGLAVFVSGCDTGLGNRLAAYFDNLGCDVFAGCLNPASSRETLPGSVTVVPLDICDENSVKDAASFAEKKLNEKGKGQLILFLGEKNRIFFLNSFRIFF